MTQLLRGLLLFVVVVAAIMARVVYSGEREIAESSAALRAGDADKAIIHARMAALWYTPGAPHVRVAYGRLMALGREAEERKMWDTSLFAFRSVVSASASTRWAIEPHAEDVARAEEAIARIEARAKVGEAPEAMSSPALAAMASPGVIPLVWKLVLGLSFVGMGGGLGALLRFGIDESGRVDRRRGLIPGVAAALGLLCYVAALFFA